MLPRRSVRALLLLSVFLAAGSSLPSLDALVYHSRAGELESRQPHVEAAGECLSHTERCTLGRTAPGSSAVGTLPDQAPIASLDPPAPRTFVTQHLIVAQHTSLAQPRAPPGTLA